MRIPINSQIQCLTITILCATLTTACVRPQHLPAQNIQIKQLTRTYHVYVPKKASTGPRPLLVAFHGGGGIGQVFPQQARFEALAESNGIILAFPQGYAFPGNEGEWQLNTRPNARHDIEFVKQMVGEISKTHSVDPKRIYAMGYSLGSMFSYEIACQMTDTFAAVASFAGTMPVSPSACNPKRFAPIMHIHGVDDSIISYGNTWNWKSWDEVGTMRNIPGLVKYWSSKYKCTKRAESKSGNSTHIAHTSCQQNARVEHHRISGLGHGWPETIGGRSAQDVIWSFLKQFNR